MAKVNNKKQPSIGFKINDEIFGNPKDYVRIVGDGIESSVVTLDEARKMASKMEMDLIEINGASKPPILRIGNYEKILYNLKKTQKKNKQQSSQVKEIMLTTNIAKHDLETKAKKAKEFIEEGHKVRVTLTMKGRELTRREESQKSILEFIVMMDDVAIPEGNLMENGNRTIVVLKKKK